MMLLAALAMAKCLAVDSASDYITAADLASALTGLSTIPADTVIAPAPAPGVRRVFPLAELRALAQRFQIAAAPLQELCIERRVAPLSPRSLIAAMQRTFPQARISILECSRQSAPEGEIEFPRAQLRTGPLGTIWSGFVRYAAHRRFNIWARVNVSVTVDRVLAVNDLHPGRPISPAEVSVASLQTVPSPEGFASNPEQVVGRIPRLLIRSGSSIRTAQLESPKEITRGDRVVVRVREGAAVLEFEAEAEGSGSSGQTIPIRNMDSGKRFRARVEAPGRVSVNASLDRRMNP
jgi:flagella basal body P-ring formation protein FlgA